VQTIVPDVLDLNKSIAKLANLHIHYIKEEGFWVYFDTMSVHSIEPLLLKWEDIIK
jgi:hypothetical protein